MGPDLLFMNSVSLFFFHLFLSVSDGVTKWFRIVEDAIGDFIAVCLRRSLKDENSLEVLNYEEMHSKRIFASS